MALEEWPNWPFFASWGRAIQSSWRGWVWWGQLGVSSCRPVQTCTWICMCSVVVTSLNLFHLTPSNLHNCASFRDDLYTKNMHIDVVIPFTRVVCSHTRSTIWNFLLPVTSSRCFTRLLCCTFYISTAGRKLVDLRLPSGMCKCICVVWFTQTPWGQIFWGLWLAVKISCPLPSLF